MLNRPTDLLVGETIPGWEGAVSAPGVLFAGGPVAEGSALAIGAVVTGILVGFGVPAGLPALILIFAVVSVIAWLVLRRVVGVREGQVKVWDRDINDQR